TLAAAGPYTFFAFTNDAFEALPVETQDALLIQPETALALLSSHIASGRLSPNWVTIRTKRIVTLTGGLLRLDPDGAGGFTVNGAPVIGPPIEAANGVIYVVGKVIE
ncbi:MAG: fasciclin domain-containing protein, partial [Chloroflexi bacterium]|nr:fasciclin domain-containing protein [Chloroflexota bacterium]